MLWFFLFQTTCTGLVHVALYISGPPGSSKSTFNAFLTDLFPQNQTSIELSKLNERFQANLICGKRLVFVHELNPKSMTSSVISFIKHMTGRDELIEEEKYGNQFNFTSLDLLFDTANHCV